MVPDFVTFGAGGGARQKHIVTFSGSVNYVQTNHRCYDSEAGMGSHIEGVLRK